MKLLILTRAADGHALTVEHALRRQGVVVQKIMAADIPVRGAVSFSPDRQAAFSYRFDQDDEFDLNHEVVWLRRPTGPSLRDEVHPQDRRVAENENNDLVDNLWLAGLDHATWVNPYEARLRANSKPLQISTAQTLGLPTPKTLISNDPHEIRQFVSEQRDRCIYKGFSQGEWAQAGVTISRLETSAVTVDDLPSDRNLQLTPGIFQERIDKDFETRVVFFDDYCIAISINSQKYELSLVDWRRAPTRLLEIKPVDVPDDVRLRGAALMKALGLRFGCFDFIVRDGEWVFIEVNQMGQFLWMEARCPDIPILSLFCQFLITAEALRPLVQSRTG